MNVHKMHDRHYIVEPRWCAACLEDGQTPKATAVTFGICPKTTAKWVACFRTESIADLRGRFPRLHKLHNPLRNTSFVGSKPCGTRDGPASGP